MRFLLAFSVVCVALQGASLTFEPVDAQYSPALGKIVMVSANPNLLHIYDPGFNTDTTVPLSYVPLAVSVSPAGDYAAVMHNGWVSYVNLLQPGTVQTFQTGVPSGSIVLSAANLYVFPFSQSEPEFLTFAWGPPFTNANGFQEGSGSARLDPAQDAIFGVRDDISPSNLFKANLASYGFSGVPTYGPYNGDYPVCGNVWFSGDGSTVYTGCGTVFHASDMTYAGSLDGLSAVQSLDESSTEVAAIPAAADTEVRLYESTYLNQTGQFALPNSAHGKWVFFNQAGTVIYAIAEAGSSYELDTIDLANPVTCVSGFTSNTSVSVAASGALENATINSNTGCAFQATSNASWISLVSGSYGSGDTTLSYVVRPNTGSQSRADTITLDSGATLTISQAGSSGISTELVNLSVNPVAADYSKALDKLVYVSAAPNELHLYDPNSQSDTFIPLALAPTSVSVDPSGLFAAVGHDGWISYVNLQSMAVQQFPIAADVNSLVLAGNGYIYAFPNLDPRNVFTLKISGQTVTLSFNSVGGQIPRLGSSANTLYVSGSDVSEWDMSQVPPIVSNSSISTCGSIWLSEDATRIYTACANVYGASPTPSLEGSLSNAGTVQWIADSEQNHSLAVIPLQPPGTNGDLIDSQLQIYSNADFSFTRESQLPPFQVNGTNYTGHGKYAFWNNSESNLVVLEQADSTAPLLSDYGVYVTSTCSYSVNSGSIAIAATGTSGAVPITVSASNGCSWYAQSQASWIQIVGGSGVGDGSVTFNAALNSGGDTRTGTITVGGQSVAISQPTIPVAQVWTPNPGFGMEEVGTASAWQSVTFTNTSSVAVSFSGIGVSGSAASDFLIERNTCGAALAAGASCAVSIAFQPTVAGSRTAYLTFTDNAYGSPQSAALNGIGSEPPPTPIAQVGPFSLGFGSEETGRLSSPQTVTFTNTGAATAWFDSIGISGNAASDFLIEGNTCGAALAAGARCGVSIAFRPTIAGSRPAYLTFADNANGSAQSVSLTGTGIQYLPVSGGSIGPTPRTGDFDGDGKSDFVVWRPSNGTWYVNLSGGGYIQQQWGLPGDIPVTGDFNGDKRTDFAVWRPSNGTWYVLFSNQAAQYPTPSMVQQWGLSGDIPVPGDYDGDGKTDFAVWRPSEGNWYVLFSSHAAQYPTPSVVRQWGLPGDIPVPGDYDGDGKTDFAVWRPSNGTWYIIPSSDPTHPIIQQWGLPGDIPVPADFDGDGRDDFAVWRPSEGNWYVLTRSQAAHYPVPTILQQWGLTGDLPQIGDFDGSGKAGFAVMRPSIFDWFVLNPSMVVQWGFPDDIPM